MGKVDSIAIDGLELVFRSHDHLPEHFHAKKKGSWEIRVYIKLCNKEKGLVYDAKWPRNIQISSNDEKKILKLVLQNKASLLEEWEQKVCIREDL